MPRMGQQVVQFMLTRMGRCTLEYTLSLNALTVIPHTSSALIALLVQKQIHSYKINCSTDQKLVSLYSFTTSKLFEIKVAEFTNLLCDKLEPRVAQAS